MNSTSQVASSMASQSRKFRSLIWQYLDCDLPRTALFYAERYFYSFPDPQVPSHDARHLLATSLLRCNQIHSAQHLVKDASCLACMEIFAECCMKLGRFRQGQDALSKCVGKGRNDSREFCRAFVCDSHIVFRAELLLRRSPQRTKSFA